MTSGRVVAQPVHVNTATPAASLTSGRQMLRWHLVHGSFSWTSMTLGISGRLAVRHAELLACYYRIAHWRGDTRGRSCSCCALLRRYQSGRLWRRLPAYRRSYPALDCGDASRTQDGRLRGRLYGLSAFSRTAAMGEGSVGPRRQATTRNRTQQGRSDAAQVLETT